MFLVFVQRNGVHREFLFLEMVDILQRIGFEVMNAHLDNITFSKYGEPYELLVLVRIGVCCEEDIHAVLKRRLVGCTGLIDRLVIRGTEDERLARQGKDNAYRAKGEYVSGLIHITNY